MASQKIPESRPIRSKTEEKHKELLGIIAELAATVDKANKLFIAVDKRVQPLIPENVKKVMADLAEWTNTLNDEVIARDRNMQLKVERVKAHYNFITQFQKGLDDKDYRCSQGYEDDALKVTKEFVKAMTRKRNEKFEGYENDDGRLKLSDLLLPAEFDSDNKADDGDGAKPEDTASKPSPGKDTDTESWEGLEKLGSDAERLELESGKKQEEDSKSKK